MFKRMLVLVAVAAVAVSGCVWKSDYTAKLTEIDGLEKNVANLEGQNKAKDQEIAGLKQQVADLTKEKEQLQVENENIKTTLESSRSQLTKDVVELKNLLSGNMERIKNLEADLDTKNKRITELQTQADQLAQEKEQAITHLKGTYDSLVGQMKKEIAAGQVQITQLKDRLTVNMVEKVLFDSGSAVIKKNGRKVLDRVAGILKNVKDQQIKVEGHTDNVPIGAALTSQFPTNWELSTARATTVVRYLQDQGVDPALLSAEGYAEYRPVASNDTEEGRAKNRRIEIVLIPTIEEK